MQRKQTESSARLAAFTARYKVKNDRFEAMLNRRDAEQRERTRERFAGLSDEVRAELAAVRR
jgi:hypothetical protein